MGIAGIDTGMGYAPYRAEQALGGTQKGDRADRAFGATEVFTFHGQEAAKEGEEAVFSWIEIQSNTSYAIYKAQDFDPENPRYIVKEWGPDGRMKERAIDVSKVDPEHCDVQELYAYSVHLKEKGADFANSILKAAVGAAAKRANDRQGGLPMTGAGKQEKVNWVEVVRELMDSDQKAGNWKSYLEWKKYLSYLEKPERRAI